MNIVKKWERLKEMLETSHRIEMEKLLENREKELSDAYEDFEMKQGTVLKSDDVLYLYYGKAVDIPGRKIWLMPIFRNGKMITKTNIDLTTFDIFMYEETTIEDYLESFEE